MPTQHETPTVLQRMSDAINAHDVDAFVSCFTNDYQSEQPLYFGAFSGLAQVRENGTALFAQVPDLRATLVASTTVTSPGLNGTGKVRARPGTEYAWCSCCWTTQRNHRVGKAIHGAGS